MTEYVLLRDSGSDKPYEICNTMVGNGNSIDKVNYLNMCENLELDILVTSTLGCYSV